MEKIKPFFDKLVCTPHMTDLKEFDEYVKAAKDAGITHITISPLSERSDYRGEDKYSPWCEWSISAPAIFKHVQPKGLGNAFPADFVERQITFLKKKHDIVGKHGLKAAYYGNEPHWLSPRVYAKHPDWRGARCDNSLRSIGMFFAPCVDHPEILALYREAIRELVKQAPLLDTFYFLANDSGSGYCWSGQLYVNPNGHSNCRGRNMGERVAGFLKTLRDGAKEGGVDAECYVSPWFPAEEAANIASHLEPGIGICQGMFRDEAKGPMRPENTLAPLGGSGHNPLSLAGALFSARKMTTRKFYTRGGGMGFLTGVKLFSETPGTGTEKDKMEFIRRFAAKTYAEDVVDPVVDAWYKIDRANTTVSGMHVGRFDFGVTALRWLVRPLVPDQNLLTEEEKSYWLPYVYQSKDSQPDTYMDYLNTTGRRMVSDWSHVLSIAEGGETVVGHLKSAAALLEQARDKTSNAKVKEKLKMDALRLHARCCVVRNAWHTIQFAVLGYIREAEGPADPVPSVEPSRLPDPKGSAGLEIMYLTMRWELDTINELIGLMKQGIGAPVAAAADKSQEGSLVYGPDVLENLEKKVAIMARHWRDAEKQYHRPLLGG